MKAACLVCDELSRKIFPNRKRLCMKHKRFQQMRGSAKDADKEVPTLDCLEELFDHLVDMKCPECGVKMEWFRKGPRRNKVMTLQHYVSLGCEAGGGLKPKSAHPAAQLAKGQARKRRTITDEDTSERHDRTDQTSKRTQKPEEDGWCRHRGSPETDSRQATIHPQTNQARQNR